MPFKLAVCYPWSSPFMFTDWAERSVNMQAPPGWDMRWFRGVGWCPARRHIDACEKALDWGADLICIIGSDQIHPEDMFPRLVARWQQGYEVVAAMVPSRGYISWQGMKPFQPMAWRFREQQPDASGAVQTREYRGQLLDGDMVDVIDRRDCQEMERVNFIGSGVLLFHRDHLLSLKRPWFAETVDPETFQRLANQDCKFVWRLQQEAQAMVWVDTTIFVKHCHVFQIDETFSGRFKDWAWGNGDPNLCEFTMPPTTVDENAPQQGQGGYLYRASTQEGVHQLRLHLVMHWAGGLKGKRVLEIGHDDGTYVLALAMRGAAEVIGCDPEPNPHQVTLPVNARVLPVRVEDLPDDIGDFDVIHLGETLEHVEDPEKLLHAVTTRWPGALYLVSVPNFTGKNHLRTYSMDSFKRLLDPYLIVEEERIIEWQSSIRDEVHKWFCVKAMVRR